MNPKLKLLVVTLIVLLTSATLKRKSKRFKTLPKYFVEVPAGYLYDSLHVGEHIFMRNPAPKKDSTERFYISETEVTNGDYALFLTSQKNAGNLDAYLKNQPDTQVWSEKLRYSEPYKVHYYQHPAYKQYPLVGVTKAQALAYCQWLSDSLNTQNNELNIQISLPTRNQWVRSARGDNRQQVYSMDTPRLQNGTGNYLYNHKVMEGQNIYRDESTGELLLVPKECREYGYHLDNGLITVVAKSYWPNQFGLYNVCGNVAEMIADDTIALGGSWNDPGFDIRIESAKSATKPSCMIGFRVVANILSN